MFIAIRPPAMLILLLLSIYVAGLMVFFVVLSRPPRTSVAQNTPRVSVIIAARDEEESIGRCLASISRIDYPKDLLQVIVVDDHSTDRTAEIVTAFAGRDPRITLVSAGAPTGHLRGKTNALVCGIDQSDGDILMFTDADCEVPQGWVAGTVRYYADGSRDLVAGFIRVKSAGWFEAIQAIDWLMLLSAASAAAHLGFPVTAVGNNLSVRRSAYDRVGGFAELPFSITEDFALFRAVTAGRPKAAAIPLDPDTVITTDACPDPGSLIRQRKRWFVGGRAMSADRLLLLAIVGAVNLAALAGWTVLDPAVWASVVLLKTTADFLLVFPSVRLLRMQRLMRYWIPFQIYLPLYLLIFPIAALLSPDVSWKNRDFRYDQVRTEPPGSPGKG